MYIAYLRVSSDKQSIETQRFEILKYAQSKKWLIDTWIEETISGTESIKKRQLGDILGQLQSQDTLIISELSRLGRNLLEIMSILHTCMEKDMRVISIKEGYELGNNINSKVLAFAFSLSAEIERHLISQRTKEALERKKAAGMTLGRPLGSKNKYHKLSGKEDYIQLLLDKQVSVSAIARILQVHRHTLSDYISTLQER